MPQSLKIIQAQRTTPCGEMHQTCPQGHGKSQESGVPEDPEGAREGKLGHIKLCIAEPRSVKALGNSS